MNLNQLDKLAESIKAKGKTVNEKTLVLESLFHKYGTLNEEQANELLWAKREQISNKIKRKYGNSLNGSLISPEALCFLGWTGKINI